MLNLDDLKPDYEGTIGNCNWSFKLFIFDQGMQNGYFRGLISHDINDGCSIEPVEGILLQNSLVITEKGIYIDAKSIIYKFRFSQKKLNQGSPITGKQTKLAKMVSHDFHDNFIRKAIIWKCC